MMACRYALETSRSKAYSSDIRWRMVHQRCVQGLPYSKIALNLNVDPSTVQRTVKLFEETTTVCSIQGYCETTEKVLTIHDKFAILEAIVENPRCFYVKFNSCH